MQIIFSKYFFLSLKIVFVILNGRWNGVGPDEMPQDAALYLGRRCLPNYSFRNHQYTKGYIQEPVYFSSYWQFV